MKKGFTLAEILITLAIIGVVAALTIPAVIHENQKQQYYARFIKVFNTVSNALQLAQAKNGSTKTWGTTDSEEDLQRNTEIYKNNLFQFLSIQQTCTSAGDCGIPNDLTVKALNGQEEENYAAVFKFGNSYYIHPVILNDGSVVQFGLGGNHLSELEEIFVDTNGIKGPNIVGRDIFFITVGMKNGISTVGYTSYTAEAIEQGCSTGQDSFGDTCAIKLLRDGKMDY